MRVKVYTKKVAGEWGCGFSIEQQHFVVRTFSKTKKEAEWHKKMLRTAFNKLRKK